MKPSQITQGTQKTVAWSCRTKICALSFLILFFSDPKSDAKSKRHKANKFNSNEGESKESDGFYWKMQESYKAKKAEVDNFASVFTQMISSNQLSSIIKTNDSRT